MNELASDLLLVYETDRIRMEGTTSRDTELTSRAQSCSILLGITIVWVMAV